MHLTTTTPAIAYEIHGTDGAPVLLIMGLAMRGLVWRPQVEGLRDHHCATYDHRGLGASPAVQGSFTLRELAADALRVLDALGWDDAHVVGASMGGMIAQELALKAPHRVRSLTLVVTHAGGRTAWLPSLRGVRGLITAWSRDAARRERGLAHLLYPDAYLNGVAPEVLRESLRDRTSYAPPPDLVRRQVRAVSRHDTRGRLDRIAAPTLVLGAARDALVRTRHVRALAAGIRGASLHVYPEAGHGLLAQEAEDVNARLSAHIAAYE